MYPDETLSEIGIIPPERILVMCSGGADSLALALMLHEQGYKVSLLHVNYGLRGAESDEGEEVVRELAAQYSMPFYGKRLEPGWQNAPDASAPERKRPDSFQMRARRIRYDFADEVAEREGYAHIATAHHADDQAETLLLSLFRDSHYGPGVKRIPFQRGKYIRPVLHLTHSNLIAYLKHRGQRWSEDSSNYSPRYDRNRLRIKVLPALKEAKPDFLPRLLAKASWLEAQHRALLAFANEWAAKAVTHSDSKGWLIRLGTLPVDAEAVILETWLRNTPAFLGDEANLVTLLVSEPGTSRDGVNGFLMRYENAIALIPKHKPNPRTFTDSLLLSPQAVVLPVTAGEKARYTFALWDIEFQLLPTTDLVPPRPKENTSLPEHYIYKYLNRSREHYGVHYLAPEAISVYSDDNQLLIRPKQPGDKLHPIGGPGTSKVKKLLHLPTHLRPLAFVICDANGPIYWAEGRIADRLKVTEHTQFVLRMEVTQNELYNHFA